MLHREKEAFWQNHVDAQEESKLTQAQYSKQHNIICSRLVYWRIRFRKNLAKNKNETASKNTFIKLGVANSKPAVVTLALADGNRIEIPETLALSLLPNLLSALKPIT